MTRRKRAEQGNIGKYYTLPAHCCDERKMFFDTPDDAVLMDVVEGSEDGEVIYVLKVVEVKRLSVVPMQVKLV